MNTLMKKRFIGWSKTCIKMVIYLIHKKHQ